MFKNKTRAVAATVAATLAISVMSLAGAGTASAANPPIAGCVIQTFNGNYLTAVGGGGRITDVIHTDATRIGSWEKFTLYDSGDGSFFTRWGFLTSNGHWLTAVGGGGRTTDTIHSDATRVGAWERFTVTCGH